MRKLTYLLFLAIGVTACSVESMDSTEELLTADAKFEIQEARDPMGFYAGNSDNFKGSLSVWNDCDNLYVKILHSGDAPEDFELGLFSSLPAINNGGNLEQGLPFDETDATDLTWTIALSTLDTEAELLIFAKAWGDWAGAEVHGRQGYSIYEFDFEGCSDCEESFTYVENEDGTYTFTYIPEEDMEDAEVVFTFPQSVRVENFVDWNSNGVTEQSIINFEACQIYTWTVDLETDCKGVGQPNANLWTDFKVNNTSKKGELDNITKGCNS